MELLKKILRFVLVAVFFLSAASLANISMVFFSYDVGDLKRINPDKTAFMSYREYDWEAKRIKDKKVNQAWIALSKISPAGVKAVLIASSDLFPSRGVLNDETARQAVEQDMKAYTNKYDDRYITRQFAINLFLTPVASPLRTAKERLLAWRIENTISPRRTLELYLNLAEWGDGIFGIEAASHHYFGKSAADLTSLDAARLAVVLPDPLRYRPTDGSEYVEKRARIVSSLIEKSAIVNASYEGIRKMPVEGPAL